MIYDNNKATYALSVQKVVGIKSRRGIK